MITIDSLTKAYGRTIAVQDISFEVKRGEVLGFLGPNGAGKTTTMKIITSFMPPTSGVVTVMGYDTVKESIKARRCIGYLPENTPLYHDMRTTSFLRFVAKAKGIKRSKVTSCMERVIFECGLEEVRSDVIRTLSKGYKQRLGLAQALISDPPVLVLDEPTMGLDPKQIYEIRQLIKDLASSRTIILSSHILPEVSQVCDKVAIINKGRIVAIDSTSSLQRGLQDNARIVLKVKEKLDETMQIINSIEGVLSVSSSNSCVLNVETTKDIDLRPELARRVVEAGIELYELSRKDMSLEEVFMELVTEEITPDA